MRFLSVMFSLCFINFPSFTLVTSLFDVGVQDNSHSWEDLRVSWGEGHSWKVHMCRAWMYGHP